MKNNNLMPRQSHVIQDTHLSPLFAKNISLNIKRQSRVEDGLAKKFARGIKNQINYNRSQSFQKKEEKELTSPKVIKRAESCDDQL